MGFVCSTLQEIKQIFYIVYLFDKMFSDSSNEWLNTDVLFLSGFPYHGRVVSPVLKLLCMLQCLVSVSVWATGQP